MGKRILLLGTLDTKGAEYAYVRDLIQARGHRVLTINAGVAEEPLFTPNIPAAVVAEAGGSNLALLREKGDRGVAMDIMMKGAAR